MNPYCRYFSQFLECKTKQKSTKSASEQRILRRILDWALSNVSTLTDFDEYVFKEQRSKEHIAELLQEFYTFCKKHHLVDEEIPSRLYDMEIIDDIPRRLIAEIGYMQNSPRTKEELVEHFGLSKVAIRRDLNMISDGFRFLGTDIHIKVLNDKGKHSIETFSLPLFFPLSNMEKLALTKVLFQHAKTEPVYGEILQQVVRKLYGNLPVFDQKKFYVEGIELGGESAIPDSTVEQLEYELGYKQQLIMMIEEKIPGRIDAYIDGKIERFENCRITDYDIIRKTIHLKTSDDKEFVLDATTVENCMI